MKNEMTTFKHFDIIMTGFVSVLIISNIASSAKIVDMHFAFFSVNFVFDGGTLIFPFSYILGDILTEVYGFYASRRAILTGFALSALSSCIFFILAVLPGAVSWENEIGSAEYNDILGGMSSGGIVIASLSGFFVGEFSNSAVLSRLKVIMSGRFLFVRTIASTLVGELLDTLVFVSVATAFGVFPGMLFFELVITNYIIKCTIEALLTPVTYVIISYLKKSEGIDIFDRKISYNPFRI